METKICSKCFVEKELIEYSKDKSRIGGYYVYCKKCRKKNYNENSDKRIKSSKDWYSKNKEKKHQEILERNRKWRKLNPSYTSDRKKIDPTFKLIVNLRRRIKRFLDLKNLTKKNKTSEIVGCDNFFLKIYIENKFTDGMSWDNQGQWHIDHIIPLSSAKTEEELYKLCHYTNLQPLWAKDNLAKSNKLPYL
jgi:hypothetical protein